MASKRELRNLIDRLPEAEVPAAQRFLEYLCDLDDPVVRAFRNAPEEDEPITGEEDKAAAEGWEQYRRGEARPLAHLEKEPDQ
jgi:hypothetical protein